jgi:hypothetical protein
MANLGRDLVSARRGAGAEHVLHQPADRRHLSADHRRGGNCGQRPRRANRASARELLSRVRGRGDRPVLCLARADGLDRPAQPRRPARRRSRVISGDGRAHHVVCLSRTARAQDRAVGGRAPRSCRASRSSPASISRRWIRPATPSCTRWSNA